MEHATRKCSSCGNELTLDNFYNYAKDKIYGKGHTCKDCNRRVLQEWRIVNKDKVAEQNKSAYTKNKKARRAGTKFCLNCGTDLVGKSYRTVYCSGKCFNDTTHKHTRKEYCCDYCKNTFVVPSYRAKILDSRESNYKFCSIDCLSNFNSANRVTQVCRWCGDSKDVSVSTVREFCSTDCYGEWIKVNRIGDKHPRWLGEAVEENKRERGSIVVKEWRVKVFERDNYTCQDCGVRGGQLEAHHIKRWKLFPELRTSLENGVTLCKECHKFYTKQELSVK